METRLGDLSVTCQLENAEEQSMHGTSAEREGVDGTGALRGLEYAAGVRTGHQSPQCF